MKDIEEFPFHTIENKEVEPLTTESIVMFVLCFVMVGLLIICLFSIICCNCINSNMDEFDSRENIMSAKESGPPISLKENPTSVRMMKKTHSLTKSVSRITKKKNNIVWV